MSARSRVLTFNWNRFRRNRLAIPSAVFLGLLITAAAAAPLVAPYDPQAQNLGWANRGPGPEHWLGTDGLGRDVLSRLIFGARVSVTVGVSSILVALLIGTPLGLLSGYIGGTLDRVFVWLMDFLLAFPRILMAILVVMALGNGLDKMVMAIATWTVPLFARLARSSSIAQRRSDYVIAAASIGASTGRIVSRHILPNSLSPLVITASLSIGIAILTESALSFLGLGVPPGTPAWGLMMSDGRGVMRVAPHVITFPGLAIVLTVLAFNFLGNGVREALDPTLRG